MQDNERDQKGRFAKTLRVWTPDLWEEGWIDNCGRFRVYRPDCPRAFELGYALRAHVVWWLEHGECHPDGTNLHHRNGDKTDDRIQNLELIEHGEHARRHRLKQGAEVACDHCGRIFRRLQSRINSRRRDGSMRDFCSLDLVAVDVAVNVEP